MLIKLNFDSIVKFEQLSSKSFNKIDYQNEDDMLKLLYCTIISNNPDYRNILYKDFINSLKSKKVIKDLIDKLNKELEFIQQFTESPEAITEDHKETKVLYMRDIVSYLIVSVGLNPIFVLNDMMINDLSMYIKAFDDKSREQLENNRLWTYMSILPHIDSKKINNPQKLLKFTWEEDTDIQEDTITIEELELRFEEAKKIINN